MLRRTFLAMVAVLGMAVTANAGSVSLYLIVDPAATAFAGVAPVAGLSTASNKSGAGTWQLYAVDEASGSVGIAQVKAQFLAAPTSIINRITQAGYDTADDSGFKAGLTLLRSGTNANPLTGSAELSGTQPYIQTGLGITAGNYSTVPGAIAFSGVTNGQWGTYAALNGQMVGTNGKTSGPTSSGNVRAALFLGEGNYTGLAPVLDLANSSVTYYTNGTTGTSLVSNLTNLQNPLNGTNPFVPEPATMTLIGLAVVGFGGLVGRRRS